MTVSLRNRVAKFRRGYRQSLLLSRKKVVNQIKAARNERYRAQLQRALDYVDARLRELDAGVSKKEDVPNGARLS